jgi:hypothetical protein
MLKRRATSLMRRVRGLRAADALDKFFLLDTGPGFL